MIFLRLLVLAILTVAAVAACGDDDEEDVDDPTATQEETDEPTVTGPRPTGPPSPPEVQGETITTESGLQYIDIVVGTGESPTETSMVEVDYTGWLAADGTKFDSSIDRGQSATFQANGLIPGFSEGLLSMKTGGKRRLIIPPELGYGEAGSPPTIPPDATLIFDVELLTVVPGLATQVPSETAPASPPEVQGETITTDSGLQYIDIVAGTGESPSSTGSVQVHYTGWLAETGTKFDSSVDRGQPATFETSGVIPGFSEGLLSMKTGGKRRLIIPPELGYGEEGSPPLIPPNATLIFDVELLGVQ